MNMFALQVKDLEDRLKAGTPHRDTYANVILGSASLRDRLAAVRDEVNKDNKLSDIGRRDALATKAKGMVRDLMELSRVQRKGVAHVAEKRAQFKAPPRDLDPTDAVGELRRQEVRAYLRSVPTDQRTQVAFSLIEDAASAEALMAAPSPALLGLAPGRFEALKQAYDARTLKARFGSQVDEIEGLSEDLEAVGAAVEMARADLQKATGLDYQKFQELAAPIAAEIDAR